MEMKFYLCKRCGNIVGLIREGGGQLSCCGEPVVLSRDRPFVVLDAPQGSKLRARLETTLQDTQVVWFQNTATTNVNDRLRGCPCEDAA